MPGTQRARRPPRQTPEEREIEVQHIRKRDRGCVVAQVVPGHVCQNANGPIPWNAVELMSIEHVKPGLGGRKPPLDRMHAVLACPWANIVTVETSAYRPLIRKWIADHEPGA